MWTQSCPEGQKCVPASRDGDQRFESLVCVPVAPNPDQTGEPCTVEGVSGKDTCDLGNFCWQVDPDTDDGVCTLQCEGSPDHPMCPEGQICHVDGGGVFTPCLDACDPLAQDCPAGRACYPWWSAIDFVCFHDASGREGQAFDSCDLWNSCDPGHLCANPLLAAECDPQAFGCCLPFCDLSLPMCTGEGAQCLPWFGEGQARPGLEDVGICGIPE